MYDRIKVIQNKIFASPDESHLLTIALDGENSWENYSDDGSNFLRNIYQLIEDDETLETHRTRRMDSRPFPEHCGKRRKNPRDCLRGKADSERRA